MPTSHKHICVHFLPFKPCHRPSKASICRLKYFLMVRLIKGGSRTLWPPVVLDYILLY